MFEQLNSCDGFKLNIIMYCYHIFLLYLFALFCLCSTHLVNIKIIRDESIVRSGQTHDYHFENYGSKASNFSGPSTLRQLDGKCFSHNTAKYHYHICPFRNVSQHELTWHSNGYRGVIGIWKQWLILNNSFDSLLFSDGDKCDTDVNRSAKMQIICGSNNEVINITESKKCHYDIVFTSPLFCGINHVYPHLGEQLRKKWDVIETNYINKELTDLGYHTFLNDLFIEASLLTNHTEQPDSYDFDSKYQCLQEFVNLKKENLYLKQLIERLQNKSLI